MTDEEGETWHQFKVTRDKEHPSLGVRLVGPNEKEIPALGTDQKEDLQGVFYRPVGPDFPLEFRNDGKTEREEKVKVGKIYFSF